MNIIYLFIFIKRVPGPFNTVINFACKVSEFTKKDPSLCHLGISYSLWGLLILIANQLYLVL